MDDYWHGAIQVLTGYVPPTRDKLFGDLLGNNDIPLMRVEIGDYDDEPSNAIVSASDDLNAWLYKSSGWRIEKTDFVIPFYSGKHGPIADAGVGTKVVMKKARITLLGHKGASKESEATGGVFLGGQFKSRLGKDFQGQNKDTTWDSRPLTQYAFGGGMALWQLLDTGKTTDFSWNDLRVANENAVDLNSFDENAKAFDRVAQFFKQRHNDLRDWEFDLGNEDAAWKGQAAGVFKDLIHGLSRNYKSYSEQFAVSGTVNSKLGDDLRAYRVGVYNAASSLYDEWKKWTVSSANPLIWLIDILEEVAKEVWYNNIVKVRYKPGKSSSRGVSTKGHHKVEFGGFYGGVRKYGPLEEMDTWKKIGEEAISRWQQRVKDVLVAAGKRALMDLESTFMDQEFPKKIDTETVSLTEKFATDQAAQEKAEQKKKEEKAQEKLEEKEAEQEAKQAEQEAKQEAKQAEQEKEQEQKEKEQEAKQAEKEAEQEQKQAEQEAKQAEKEAEQEQKQEQLQQEQEAKQAEKEAEQEAKQAEQEAKQEQLQQEQEQKQAEQEAKQAEKEAEQGQKQEQLQQEQEQKQAEQEAKQEQKQAEQEAQQEQKEKEAEQQQLIATNQARVEREQQKKEQERKEAEQEAKQAEQEAEQEAKQAEQEAKQEEKEKEAEQKQAEQEQKQIKTESEFQEKQAEQEAVQAEKQAEQEAVQAEKEAEQEAKQEQLQQEQEQKQAEQEAVQAEKEAEQEA
ncbi:AAWKG family protein, partial [Streptomyces xiangluensis]